MNKPHPTECRWSRRALSAVVVLSLVFFIAGMTVWYIDFDLERIPTDWLLIAAVAFLVITATSLIGLRRPKEDIKHNAAIHELASELSQVANKSEIVINAIGDGVLALDGNGVIQLINPAAETMLGWQKQDAEGLDYRSVLKLLDETGNPIPEDGGAIQAALVNGQPLTRNDLMLTTDSGRKINISLLLSPVGKAGDGAIAVFRDITSEFNENKQKTEFVSTASHEMRTPVAAIEGYLGLALNPATAQIDDKARVYLMKAHESAQHLGRLFQDLLDISKAEDGRLNSKPHVIELVSFARETTDLFTARAAEVGLEYVFEPDKNQLAQVLYIHVDSDHLREVLTNLIENAVKYTKKGKVSVNVTGTKDKAILSIQDSGIGIAREDIPHLFQKFYRIDNTDTREIGGTGLGLYLCRRLVESMDGRIWVESEIGKGSTFFVELNRISPEEADRINNQLEVVS